jgi:hypothetical protein
VTNRICCSELSQLSWKFNYLIILQYLQYLMNQPAGYLRMIIVIGRGYVLTFHTFRFLLPVAGIGRTSFRNNCSRCLFRLHCTATCFGPHWPSSGGTYNILLSYYSHNGSVVFCNKSYCVRFFGQILPLLLKRVVKYDSIALFQI